MWQLLYRGNRREKHKEMTNQASPESLSVALTPELTGAMDDGSELI